MKTETPHTSTPWEFFTSPEDETHIAAKDGGCTIARMGDRSFDPDCPRDVNEADAAFICRAANCHDELVELVTRFHLMHNAGNRDHTNDAWRVNARLAAEILAKATGEKT